MTASFYDARNSLTILAKNYPRDLWRKYGSSVIRGQLRRALDALRAWRGKEARATLRGMATGLLLLPGSLRKRRQIQALRRVGLDYLESILTPPLP